MDNVISLKSGRTLEEEIKIKEESEKIELEETKKIWGQNKEGLLDMLKKMQSLVETDRIDGMVLIAHDCRTNLFNTQISMRPGVVPRSDTMLYLGQIEAIRMEIADLAQMAPYIDNDGEIQDPWIEEEYEEFLE